jgi:hypothetical protein
MPRYNYLVGKRFDVFIGIVAGCAAYFSHEKEIYPSPTDQLIPLGKQFLLERYPQTSMFFDQNWMNSKAYSGSTFRTIFPELPSLATVGLSRALRISDPVEVENQSVEAVQDFYRLIEEVEEFKQESAGE